MEESSFRNVTLVLFGTTGTLFGYLLNMEEETWSDASILLIFDDVVAWIRKMDASLQK